MNSTQRMLVEVAMDGHPTWDDVGSGPEPDVHVKCGQMMRTEGVLMDCSCHRYCDPRWCRSAAKHQQRLDEMDDDNYF
jgi:hypothetical protein